MGAELECRVKFGSKSSAGRALLETNEIVFRGDFRLKIPLKHISSVKAANGNLSVKFPEGEAVFSLGPAAEKWADKILHPKSVIEKLGVKSGQKIAVLGVEDKSFLGDLSAITKFSSSAERNCDAIFFGADAVADLKKIPALSRSLASAGALWIVYPKGLKDIREIDVIAAGRAAKLKDVKVVGFSPTHTALKFVMPLADR
ncbi:MAG TPA: hypothetical protein VFO34_17285 [Candidatus Acidoferrales bacterium]|nr:hypothetical protein [Candidatus Acidoferrales bacterium]